LAVENEEKKAAKSESKLVELVKEENPVSAGVDHWRQGRLSLFGHSCLLVSLLLLFAVVVIGVCCVAA